MKVRTSCRWYAFILHSFGLCSHVFLPAIAGHVPAQMVRALSAFRKFRYLVRRDAIDEDIFAAIDEALERFHRERVIFE